VRARTWILVVSAAGVIAVLGAVGLAPVASGSHEQVFEIPQGTWARRMAGDKIETLPDHIYLTVGVRDILVLKNHDAVPQTFGPTLLMPGQSFTLPFERAAEYQFACTAHASGQMTIVVDPYPATPWAKISWRTRGLIRRL
jgi:hypothetical protein